MKGLLIGGRERSCRGLGRERAGGRGEGGERFPRKMNAAQPGLLHCPEPGCSTTSFPSSSIPFPPSASEALCFSKRISVPPSRPACLPAKWNPGWGNPPAAAAGAGPELSGRSGPRDAEEDACGAGWESPAVPRRSRAPAGNADSPTTPTGVAWRRAAGRRQGYPAWPKVLGEATAALLQRQSDSTLQRSFFGAQAPASRSRSAPLGQPLSRPRSWDAPSQRFQAWLLKVSARKAVDGRSLLGKGTPTDRPTLRLGHRRGFRRHMLRNRRYGRKYPAAAAAAPTITIRNPFSLGGFACHRELP